MNFNHFKDNNMDIPPTIESCGGSLHSEDDDDFGRDSTEGNLYSDGELDNGEMNASHKHNEIDDNRKSDKKWRGLVTLMLMGNAIIIVGSTYGFLANQETRDFYASFERYADSIIESCHYHATSVAVTFESVSDSVTTFVRDTDAQWPFVTLSDFEVRSQHAREQSFLEMVGFVPLVANGQRMEQWQVYKDENMDAWLRQSRATAAILEPQVEEQKPVTASSTPTSTSSTSSGTASTTGTSTSATTAPQEITTTTTVPPSIPSTTAEASTDKSDAGFSVVSGSGNTRRDLQETSKRGPFAPIWQMSPPPSIEHEEIIGFDLLEHDVLNKLLFAMYETGNTAVSQVMDVAFMTGEQLKSSNKTQIAPTSVIFQPIYERHSFPYESNPQRFEPPKLQGVYFGVLNWESYFIGLLPEGVNGIDVVVRNDCDQDFTYRIYGQEAMYMGMGDHHETLYDPYEISTSFAEFHQDGQPVVEEETQAPDAKSGENSTASTTPSVNKDQFQCYYSLSIYPSNALRADQETSRPVFFTMIVALIFVATAIVFFVYLKFMQSRTRRVEKVAKASDKIITSLFPEDVKKQLMNDAEEQTRTMSGTRHSKQNDKTSPLVQEFLAGGDEESAMMSKDTMSRDTMSTASTTYIPRFKTKPIANLFQETTIFFADIAGFTKWSSSRSPTEVFELLEAIYGTFDELAKKRQVYKVETIGDCYVAVAGLPKPVRRHALVMTRFAQDCLIHIGKVTKSLEASLGADTSELTMRIGLHSGAVTAGVLRGERSRFQLFGDTVNTAARMESHGKPKCIHVSEVTAELLRGHGRGAWLTKREDLVEAKGKGKLQTYWVRATSAAASNSGSERSSHTKSSHESKAVSEMDDMDSVAQKVEDILKAAPRSMGGQGMERTSSWLGDMDVSSSDDDDDEDTQDNDAVGMDVSFADEGGNLNSRPPQDP